MTPDPKRPPHPRRPKARSAAQDAALQAQAQADLAWFESEQRRRGPLLAAEKAALEVALERSRRQLSDSEAKVRK